MNKRKQTYPEINYKNEKGTQSMTPIFYDVSETTM